MTGYRDVQEILDRVLGASPAPTHGPFWRGKSRDEFIQAKPFGLDLIVVGDAAGSYLVKALRGQPPFGSDLEPRPPKAIMRRMPAGLPPAAEEDIRRIEQWIENGCPEESEQLSEPVSDDVHVRYWREVDLFFLPNLSSAETKAHVNRVHIQAYLRWSESREAFTEYMAQSQNQESLAYIQHHQERIVLGHYGTSPDPLFESIWKFGGNLLPIDPLSQARPQHTMNSVSDWFFWAPSLQAALERPSATEFDLRLARAWQVGIIADGLLREDADRSPNQRMPIADFDAGDPNLASNVQAAFRSAESETLIELMRSRHREFQPES